MVQKGAEYRKGGGVQEGVRGGSKGGIRQRLGSAKEGKEMQM